MLRIVAVIPTYNERENIRILIPRILQVFRQEAIDGRIIIVDDASPDGTGKVAEELAEDSDRIFVLQRSGKMGLGSAYKDGFRYALSIESEGIIEMDADLSHDPVYIREFVGKLSEGYDLAMGSRYVPGGKIPKWSLYRRLVSNITNKIARFLLGLAQKDVTTGYRGYSSNALRKVDLTSIKSDGYAFQVEMTLKCQRAGLKICEIPIAFVDRKQGETKLTMKEMWRFLISIIRMMLMG